MTEPYLTVEDVMHIYAVSKNTVYGWVKDGYLEIVRLPGGRLIRIEPLSLDNLNMARRNTHHKR